MKQDEYTPRPKKESVLGDDTIKDNENMSQFDEQEEPFPMFGGWENGVLVSGDMTNVKDDDYQPVDTTDIGDFDIKKFFKNNRLKIASILLFKVFGFLIVLLLSSIVMLLADNVHAGVVSGIVGIIIVTIISKNKYGSIVKKLVQKLDNVKSYKKNSDLPIPVIDMLSFKALGHKIEVSADDQLTVDVCEKDVQFAEFTVTNITYKGKYTNYETLFVGLYAVAKSPFNFPHNTLLRHGEIKVPSELYPVRRSSGKHESRYTIMSTSDTNINQFDMDKIDSFVDSVIASTCGKPFVMLFEGETLHFIMPSSTETFSHGFLESVKDCLCRDIYAMARRVKIAKVIGSDF
jgi:hypothetical protein